MHKKRQENCIVSIIISYHILIYIEFCHQKVLSYTKNPAQRLLLSSPPIDTLLPFSPKRDTEAKRERERERDRETAGTKPTSRLHLNVSIPLLLLPRIDRQDIIGVPLSLSYVHGYSPVQSLRIGCRHQAAVDHGSPSCSRGRPSRPAIAPL